MAELFQYLLSHAELSVIITFVEKLKDDLAVKGFRLDQCVNFSHELFLKTLTSGQHMHTQQIGRQRHCEFGCYVCVGCYSRPENLLAVKAALVPSTH